MDKLIIKTSNGEKVAVSIDCTMSTTWVKISVRHRVAQKCSLKLPGVWDSMTMEDFKNVTFLDFSISQDDRFVRNLKFEFQLTEYIRRHLIVEKSVNFEYNNSSKVSEEIMRAFN